ncbi:MAG TPA: hypothetical protein VHD63_16005, partial [Ktedonobacteraceae bacterium]|nr:hypothetical protein [Ktedonobacteraceae bacterium]
MKQLTDWLGAVLRSRFFTYGVLAFFVFEAAWIAASAVYPMAFDEDFHFGLIQFYSHHWTPFLATHQAGTSQFGAVSSDPSYLYHYLMSFPYRGLSWLVHGQTAQVVVLRFLNIALFAAGLALWYRLLRRVGSSRLLANTALALFVLIPIVPLLAAHINYDNLLFPLAAWVCLLVLKIDGQLRAGRIDIKTLGILVAACMLSCLVKYPFLPIALAVALFVGVRIWRHFCG